MSVLMRPWGHLHYRLRGPDSGLPVVLLNSLGTDLRMWEGVADRLPAIRLIGMDKRGHGLSATPTDDWTLDDLAADALALMDHLGVARAADRGLFHRRDDRAATGDTWRPTVSQVCSCPTPR